MSKHPSADILRTIEETTLPSTSEVATTLEKTKGAIDEEVSKKGYFTSQRKIGMETAQLVETTKEFIEEKNKGELMQKMVKDAALAIEELTKMFQTKDFFNARQQMITIKLQAQNYTEFAQQNLEALKNLALTLINSSQFRGLLVDCIELVEQTFHLEAKTATPLTPAKESLQPLTEEVKLKPQQVQVVGEQVMHDVKEGTLPIPEDKKQEIKFRFKTILHTLANDTNYRSAVDGILAIVDQVTFYSVQLKEQAIQDVEAKSTFFYSEDSAIYRFFFDLKLFLAGFAGHEALARFNTNAYEFLQLVMNDQRLSNFFWEFRQFIVEALANPALPDDENFNSK